MRRVIPVLAAVIALLAGLAISAAARELLPAAPPSVDVIELTPPALGAAGADDHDGRAPDGHRSEIGWWS